MRPLRLMTCGHVDDGKSTLIGRLLVDSESLYEDQLAEAGGNLAHFTDGLKAERELGITIDIAFRFFRTRQRKFILVDAPGHFQYTRNMVTGASQVEVALLLVDASRGLSEQTFRHAFLVNLLRLEKLFVLVNKMDLVGYSKEKFDELCEEFRQKIPLSVDCQFLPISALLGENIVHRSEHMPWYNGPCLLPALEIHQSQKSPKGSHFQMAVQMVSRGQNSVLCAGTVSKGSVQVGQELQVLSSRAKSRVRKIYYQLRTVPEARDGMAVTVELERSELIQRGDWLCGPQVEVLQSEQVTARVVWMQNKRGVAGTSWILKHSQLEMNCQISEILDRKEIHQLQKDEPVQELGLNDIARVNLKFEKKLSYQPYSSHQQMGSAILIDPEDYSTVAAVLFE